MSKALLLSFVVLALFSLNAAQERRLPDWKKPKASPTIQLASSVPYKVTEGHLRQIRSSLLYSFSDQDVPDMHGDYQRDIHASNPQIQKNFNFTLPFLGFHFKFIKVSLNGYVGFSDPPEQYTYPLTFPIKIWPRQAAVSDPSFIGIFYSKIRIGSIRSDEIDQRRPGVYFKLVTDLQNRTDKLGVELRERLNMDIHEGIQDSEDFAPIHVMIVTWKNVSFAGGIDKSLFTTNTFQIVLTTNEEKTYAIFNYADVEWTTHTEAGGDTELGIGGIPAFVGFNAGNGTQSYEYHPYSQSVSLPQIAQQGCGNGFPGRHIFRVDTEVILANCMNVH